MSLWKKNTATRLAASTFILLAASACSMTGMPGNQNKSEPALGETGLGYYQERFERNDAALSFQDCKQEGIEMDRLARQSANAGQYLTSASILAGCDSKLGSAAQSVEEGERMRVMALAAQNFANGGDVARARQQLDGFKSTFHGRDLYFADGTSWIESFELALGMLPDTASGAFSTTNANKVLKAEMRRSAYWLSN